MSKKILIADQSETVRGVAEDLFRKKGFEVVSASDGVEALELAHTPGIDLVFLNAGLPEIDGYTVSKEVKSNQQTQNVKVVLLLSTAEMVNQHLLLSSLADRTLNKPFSPKDLIESASEALGVEIESDEDKEELSTEAGDVSEDIEELDFGENHDEEIDFGSIFAGDESVEQKTELDEILFSNKENSESADDTGIETSSEKRNNNKELETEMSKEPEKDSAIRLADDQYGLEAPLPEPEIEVPHDYSWFIREMKKELTDPKSGSDSMPSQATTSTEGPTINAEKGHSAVPGMPRTKTTKTGQFTVEEIGSSKIDISGVKSLVESEEENQPFSHIDKPIDYGEDSARLSLAEKLLIKEIGDKVAEKLVDRLSTEKLRQTILEVLASLKKM